ncbi:type 1 fimbrial protein [Burkholderia sp. AU28942]|uniref:fimbrial protein n=1 Tax=Burkholderia TaxID=32008 RepID=UPI0009F6A7BE|nr:MULTISPECIES: fimbrial protein [Burkholderia]MCA8309929.1 type 1 fimbrial protein [Burkholderia sp. AU28942]QTO51699.1 type 1 fimbrial protein [Burkholderia latens]
MSLIKATLITVMCLIGPLDAHALSCWQGKENGPVTAVTTLPGDLYVLASMEEGGVIWESGVISQHIYCSSNIREPISFWVNPRNAVVGEGVEVAIRYKGKLYRQSDGSIPTGLTIDRPMWFWFEQEFDISYSLVLLRKGAAPATGETSINNYSVFQLDGRYGVNPQPAMNFNHLINGRIRFSPGTCDLRVGDRNRVVPLPSVSTSRLSAVGSTAGRQTFSVAMENCAVGVKQVSFSFTGDPDADMPSAFRNTGTAKGVAIRLSKADDNTTLGANGIGNSASMPVTDNSVMLNLAAEYIATNGRPGGGTVNSLATMTINYQ